MRRQHAIVGTFILAGFAAFAVSVLLPAPGGIPAQAQQVKPHVAIPPPTVTPNVFFPPLPPVPIPPDVVVLDPMEALGKLMIFDNTLSNPIGYACFQCHTPTAGGTSGLSSVTNLGAGPQPGVIPGRSGPRRPLGYPYAAYSPVGPFFDPVFANAWVGGNFWDGRVPDLSTQARQPFVNPNEMNNTPTGPFPPPAGGFSALVVSKVQAKYGAQFQAIYGFDVFTSGLSTQQLYILICDFLAAYQASGEVNQFSSKYDASQFGVPPGAPFQTYTLSASEERGRQLYFGIGPQNAHCAECHSSSADPPVLAMTEGKDTFTMYCFANIGVPKNLANPWYQNTDPIANPNGFNPLGTAFIDFGLGANPNPAPDGTVFNNPATNSPFLGLFIAPTTRNVDLRPTPTFVKAYMHNGVFKSLATVVHFYNKRNIAVNAAGVEVAFDLSFGPPPGFTRLFAPPEVLTNVNNPPGLQSNTPGVAQVGNLGLSATSEADLVNFMTILSDGFTAPKPVGNPAAVALAKRFSKKPRK
jgi:cytochrome c peroxidase